MNVAPLRGEYQEVICLKTRSIIHLDWGNIEVFEGQTYRECVSGYGYLKENICKDDCVLIEVGGMLWPFDKSNFATKSDLRDIKLTNIGI